MESSSDIDGEPIREEIDGPLREPMMPRVSIRFMILLTALSAVAMVIAQQAVMYGKMWAAAITIPLLLGMVLFGVYAGTFMLANVFSTVSSAAVAPDAEGAQHSPTLYMPNETPIEPSRRDGGEDADLFSTVDDWSAAPSSGDETNDSVS